MKPLEQLKALKQKSSAGATESFDPDVLVEMHHILMKEYGWIPINEFKELPIPALWNLMGLINEDRLREQREYEKSKHKGRSRR